MGNNIEKYKDILFAFLYRDEEYPAVKKSKGHSFKKILTVSFYVLNEDLKNIFRKNNLIINDKIWLYAESENQYNALKPLMNISNSILVTSSEKLIKKHEDIQIFKLVLPSKFKFRIFRFPFFYHYIVAFKNKFKDHLATIIKYDGLYESLISLLRKHKPKAIIFSNDHNAYCRALMIASKDLDVKTVYIQHAAVTDRFPPLKFDLNLLEGQDSLEKYKRAGNIEGKVELVGMLKFDKYFHLINYNHSVKSIGLALNGGDDFNLYFNTFFTLRDAFPDINFHVRFHPSTKINQIKVPEFFTVSNTFNENSFDFLSKVDVLFAGNSSIHLEATLMNVISHVIKFNDITPSDYYNFIKNNLVNIIEETKLIDEISEIRDRKYDVRNRAKFYVETIGSEWDGKSRILVTKILNEFLNERANIQRFV